MPKKILLSFSALAALALAMASTYAQAAYCYYEWFLSPSGYYFYRWVCI